MARPLARHDVLSVPRGGERFSVVSTVLFGVPENTSNSRRLDSDRTGSNFTVGPGSVGTLSSHVPERQLMNLKRMGAIVGTAALLAVGAVVGLAAPASAHNADVTASAQCESDGTYTITWVVKTANTPTRYGHKSNTFDAWVTSPVKTQIGDGVAPNTGVTWVQKLVAGTTTSATASFKETWLDHYSVSTSGSITLNGGCGSAPSQNAVASATITPPTCQSDGKVAFAVQNARWRDRTPSSSVGSHTRVAVADAGHLFSDGRSTLKVEYTIEAKLKQGACTPTGYQTVVWQMPTKPSGPDSSTWPQTFVSATPENVETLAVDVPTLCDTYYQVDSYVDNATTQSLIAAAKSGTKLTSPGHPAESLAPGGLGTAWRFVINPDCASVTEPTVSSTDNVCGNGTSNATLTLPAVEGIVWNVGGSTKAPGTYPMSPGGPNVITAAAAPGYTLAHPFEQDVTFGPIKTNQSTNPQGDCYVAPTVAKCATPLPDILASNLDDAGWTYSTSSAGHHDYTPTTLRVWTDATAGGSSVDGIRAVDIPLQDAGAPAIDLTKVSGASPDLRLGIDLGGDGVSDGTLVYQGGDQWGTTATGFGVPAGSGFAGLGTLQDYLAANPKATIVSVGFELESTDAASAEIVSITVGCQRFTFDSKPVAVTAVTPSSSDSDSSSALADTGSNLTPALAAGGMIIALGAIALAFGMIRRRRSAEEH